MALTKLGRYDLYSIRAKGAMGQVYEGFDPDLNRPIAIKTIRVEHLADDLAKEFESRFRTEARAAGRLHHPNIVSIYDAGRDQGVAYLVMELVQGDDLKCQLEGGTAFPLARALAILRELLSALHYAHEQGVVHRDVKPGNILLDAGGHVKLGDFGVSRIVDSGDATRVLGSMVGTLRYMSPEQVCGQKVDSRSDLFAAGVVAYQLLTGRQPFDGQNDFEIARHVVEDHPPLPSSVAPHVAVRYDAVIMKALAKDPAERFRTALDFAAALRTALRDESSSNVDPGPPRTPVAEVVERRRQGRSDPTGPSARRIEPATSSIAHELELTYWKDINESEDPRDFEQFLDRFSGGIYENLARRRLRKLLSAETVVTSREDPGPVSTEDGLAPTDPSRSGSLDLTRRLEPPLSGIETGSLLAPGTGKVGSPARPLYPSDEAPPAPDAVAAGASVTAGTLAIDVPLQPAVAAHAAAADVLPDEVGRADERAAPDAAPAVENAEAGSSPRPAAFRPRIVVAVAVVLIACALVFARSRWSGGDAGPSDPPPSVRATPADAPAKPASTAADPPKPAAPGEARPGVGSSAPIGEATGAASPRVEPASPPVVSPNPSGESADARAQAAAERLRRQKAEAERKAREREDRDRADRERLERDRLEAAQRQKAEQGDRERATRAERDRLDRLEQDRAERERSERSERERLERVAREKADRERQDGEAKDREKAQRESERARDDALEKEKRKRIGSPPVF